MAGLTIRNLDQSVKARLRQRAAAHGRSVEEEARAILCAAVAAPSRSGAELLAAIRQRVEVLGGVELEMPMRTRRWSRRDFRSDRHRDRCARLG